jgi:inosose dehydratase
MESSVKIGTAPDSWGVWFPDDPKQIPWGRFLDEVVEAGYNGVELGPPGYLPFDVTRLSKEIERRKLKVLTGFVMRHFDDASQWSVIEKEVMSVGTVLQALSAPYLLPIDDTYTNLFTGEPTGPSRLEPEAWKRLIETIHHVAALAKEKFGLQTVFHPHAETHVESEDQIEKFLEHTDPALIFLCLDTGHHAYRGGDPVAFMRKHHKRIAHLHLKSVDREIQKKVEAEHIPFAKAVEIGIFCEPSHGAVDFEAFRDVLHEVGYRGWAVVEQDMYAVPFDMPLPIAKRTRKYLKEIGIG